MYRIARPFRLAAVFAIAGALGWLNWTMAKSPIDTSPLVPGDTSSTSPPTGPAVPPAVRGADLADLGETLKRPLFSETRRPQDSDPPVADDASENSPPPVAATAPRAESSGLRLAGVMGQGQKVRQALILIEGMSHGKWVEVGGEIDGWRIASIEDGRVVVRKEATAEELLLRRSPPE